MDLDSAKPGSALDPDFAKTGFRSGSVKCLDPDLYSVNLDPKQTGFNSILKTFLLKALKAELWMRFIRVVDEI